MCCDSWGCKELVKWNHKRMDTPEEERASLGLPWWPTERLRLRLSVQGVQVQSLVMELRSRMPPRQKTKT